jgi:DNA-binding LytR/AlgR family response regulator
MPDPITAVIADDEPLLREALVRELQSLWPELNIVATATNGLAAIDALIRHQPDIAFLDIQMPGATGIEVAENIADEWPDDTKPPLIVFVTAFDQYAVDAFKTAAIDYLLKPVNSERLQATKSRIEERLGGGASDTITRLSQQVRQLLEVEVAQTDESIEPLRIIRAGAGDTVKMIPVEQVALFESADKYISVYTTETEALIRESLRSLLLRLDREKFVQIHRGAVVNLNYVEAAVKDDTGKLTLRLRGIDKTPTVSRVYRHLFQAM